MLDIKFIRENVDIVQRAITSKGEKANLNIILELDAKKRSVQFEYDQYRNDQRILSEEIPRFKKQGRNVKELLDDLKERSEIVKKTLNKLNKISYLLELELLTVPNIPNNKVPVGNESENKFIKEWGSKKTFAFQPKDHLVLAEKNDLLELKRVPKLSGTGFVGYKNKGALLERSLINFMLDFHIQKHGYTEVSLPVLVNRKTMTGTGQLPKLEEDMYRIEQDDLFLVPTAEVSVTNLYASEILPLKMLPQKFVSYSPCFRREAGSYGRETKGLQRIHQFNKVEIVRFVQPENSYQVLEEMLGDAEDILQALGLHYRVLTLATGDLSFASAITYDLEVWAPGAGKYLEVSSVSNFEDFQARRASIRFRDIDDKVRFVHTLNGSGLATPRTFIALIETYQNEDGSITLPDVLVPYLSGLKKL